MTTKAANILVTLSGLERVSSLHLADFGVSERVENSNGLLPSSIVGTFIAPEVQRNDGQLYNAFKADGNNAVELTCQCGALVSPSESC